MISPKKHAPGDPKSRVVFDLLKEEKASSGLLPSARKSAIALL